MAETKIPGCMYCEADSPKRNSLMLKVLEYPESTLYLMKDQQHQGRCVLALKEHKRELCDLSPETLLAYMTHAGNVAEAIIRLFDADKVNYAIFGDVVGHMHMHLVPKQKDGIRWGDVFEMTSKTPRLLDDAQYEKMITSLRNALSAE